MHKDLLLRVVQPAAELIKKDFWHNGDVKVDLKSSIQDIVTGTDKQSQQLIMDGLLREMAALGVPADQIRLIGEENKLDTADADHAFIADPLDGTTNFAAQLSPVCISLAYAFQKELQIGLVYNPLTDECFWAEKGQGAWYSRPGAEPMQLKAPEPKELAQILIAAHLNGADVVAEQFAWYQNLFSQVRGERNCGSLTWDLCLMAKGVFGAALNKGCYLWDVAAAKVILDELGIGWYDDQGQPFAINWQQPHDKLKIIVAHPTYLSALLAARPEKAG